MGIYTMNACLILAGVCLFLLASTCAKPNVSSLVRLVSYEIKAAVLQIILKKSLVTNISKYLFIYIKKLLEMKMKKTLHISLFCHRDIPTIHNGYCVINAVDYAKKNDVVPTIVSTELWS